MAKEMKPMTKSGFCMFLNKDGDSHKYCKLETCDCTCHAEEESV